MESCWALSLLIYGSNKDPIQSVVDDINRVCLRAYMNENYCNSKSSSIPVKRDNN